MGVRVILVHRGLSLMMIKSGRSLRVLQAPTSTTVHLLVEGNCTSKMTLTQTRLEILFPLVVRDVMTRGCLLCGRFALPLLFLLLLVPCRLLTEWLDCLS